MELKGGCWSAEDKTRRIRFLLDSISGYSHASIWTSLGDTRLLSPLSSPQASLRGSRGLLTGIPATFRYGV